MNKFGMIRFLLCLAMAVAGFVSSAAAQDAAPAADGIEAPEAGSAEASAIDDSTASEAEKALEKDLAQIWGRRREVQVVQRRLFAKDGRLEAAAFSGIIPNDDFIIYYPVGLRLSYHFSEAFTVEGSFAHAIDSPTALTEFLTSDEVGIDLKRADIQEYIRRYFNVNILWAPIYGKISLLGLKLSHFETYVGMGFGFFQTHEIPADNPNGNDKTKASGNTIFGFRWFLTDMINIRTEYRQYFFQKFGGGVSIPVELTLGLGFTI
ncbi:MAG: outer membrane beta-barrel domain-containing protein [Bradymonadia bacterium]